MGKTTGCFTCILVVGVVLAVLGAVMFPVVKYLIHSEVVQVRFVGLFVCFPLFSPSVIDELPIKRTRKTPTRGYKHQAGHDQSLSYKHWFDVYDYELHKSRNCDSVTR